MQLSLVPEVGNIGRPDGEYERTEHERAGGKGGRNGEREGGQLAPEVN